MNTFVIAVAVILAPTLAAKVNESMSYQIRNSLAEDFEREGAPKCSSDGLPDYFPPMTCGDAVRYMGCDFFDEYANKTLRQYCCQGCRYFPFENKAQMKAYKKYTRALGKPTVVMPGPGAAEPGSSYWKLLRQRIIEGQKWGTASLNCTKNWPFLKRIHVPGNQILYTNHDNARTPYALVVITNVEAVKYSEVSAEFASVEGEGPCGGTCGAKRSLTPYTRDELNCFKNHWEQAHDAFFLGSCEGAPETKAELNGMTTLLTSFQVLYSFPQGSEYDEYKLQVAVSDTSC